MNKKNFSLSIIVPVFNERASVINVLQQLDALKLPLRLEEIIIVDDGSTDGTAERIKAFKSKKKNTIRPFFHRKNQGKGQAIRTGIAAVRGKYILIQDADLEYDPKYIPALLTPILAGQAEVVFGTRLRRLPDLKRDERTTLFLLHYAGNKVLSLLISLLYGQWLTDMETGYKLFPASFVRAVPLEAMDFRIEPEITIKLIKKGYKIYEVPIRTTPRGYQAGKKLRTVRDGLLALGTIIKYVAKNDD